MIAVLILIAVVLFVVRTKTGRYIYAIGNSREAAKIMGIRVDRIRLLIYGIVGLLSSTAGMLYVARLGSAQAAIGTNWPMNSIAACVIGGVLPHRRGGESGGLLSGSGHHLRYLKRDRTVWGKYLLAGGCERNCSSSGHRTSLLCGNTERKKETEKKPGLGGREWSIPKYI